MKMMCNNCHGIREVPTIESSSTANEYFCPHCQASHPHTVVQGGGANDQANDQAGVGATEPSRQRTATAESKEAKKLHEGRKEKKAASRPSVIGMFGDDNNPSGFAAKVKGAVSTLTPEIQLQEEWAIKEELADGSLWGFIESAQGSAQLDPEKSRGAKSTPQKPSEGMADKQRAGGSSQPAAKRSSPTELPKSADPWAALQDRYDQIWRVLGEDAKAQYTEQVLEFEQAKESQEIELADRTLRMLETVLPRSSDAGEKQRELAKPNKVALSRRLKAARDSLDIAKNKSKQLDISIKSGAWQQIEKKLNAVGNDEQSDERLIAALNDLHELSERYGLDRVAAATDLEDDGKENVQNDLEEDYSEEDGKEKLET
jgi:hypothetical protein